MEMELRKMNNGVELIGYANVPGKLSKKIRDSRGYFVERIEEGAFKRSLEANSNIPLLLNHDKSKVIASGNDVEIKEDCIGLKVRAFITDNNVIKSLKKHKESGFSFGFYTKDQEFSHGEEGLEVRTIKDLELTEVSLLIGEVPAYNNTAVVEVRNDGTEELLEYRLADNVELKVEDDIQEDTKTITEDQLEVFRKYVETLDM